MFVLLATSLFFINEPVTTMREEPAADARVASQAIFPEQVEIEKEANGWAYIKTPDGYTGWAPMSSIIKREMPYETSATVSRLAAHVYGVKDTEFGPIVTLPFGAKLQVVEDSDPRWTQVSLLDGKLCYIQKGDIAPLKKLNSKEDLVAFSQQFLNLPYTWGGRSSFGYDCSGFVQMLYEQINQHLPRDSKQQIKDDRFESVHVDHLEPGDLIFFGKSADKISHVGMAIGEGKFIHSVVHENKPWIRISNLADDEWNGENLHREAKRMKKS